MKKFALMIATVATLMGNGAYAQPANSNKAKPVMSTNNTGYAAQQAGSYSSNSFAWGVGLVGLVVIGTVVGLTVSAATHSPDTSFSH
jgi:hypothetical protein